jgi:quercetin dioxygenase-like cupin family protein
VPSGDGQFFELGDHRGWGKVASAQNGGAFLLAETVADPDGGVPPHIHTLEDEAFFILSGRFALQIEGHSIEAGPGDTVFAPRNLMHTWRCISDTPGKFLLTISPGENFETFIGEISKVSSSPAECLEDPAAAAAFMNIAQRHGIEMIPAIK